MKELKPVCDVNTCMLCRLCLKDWLPAVRAARRNFQFNKGELLFKEGDEMTGVYFIYQGTVKVHKHWGDDKELIVRLRKMGRSLAIAGWAMILSFRFPRQRSNALLYVLLIRNSFSPLLKSTRAFLYELMMFFAAELKESEKNMRNLAHMPVKGRIAQALFTLKEKFGTDPDNAINIQLTRQDIASFVGTTYETLFRLLNEMSEEGSIKSFDKKIEITDAQKLAGYIKTF